MKILKYLVISLGAFISTSFGAPVTPPNGGNGVSNCPTCTTTVTSAVNLPSDINLQNAYNNAVLKQIKFPVAGGLAFLNSMDDNLFIISDVVVAGFEPFIISGDGATGLSVINTDDSISTFFQIKSTEYGSAPFPFMTTAQENPINLTNAPAGWGVFDTNKKTFNVWDGAEKQDVLTAQHVEGTGTVTVTNNGDGTVTINGSGGSVPDAAYSSFSTQNNSFATVFPAINTFKPIVLGTVFSKDQSSDFSNSFMTIDSVSTPVMTYTGATTQFEHFNLGLSVRGAVASSATFKFCAFVRLQNGTIQNTEYCQIATIDNLIDFKPIAPITGNISLATGDALFIEVENTTNTNSVYAAFSNYSIDSVAGSIANTNGLPEGASNLYLSQDGGATLASKTGAVINGNLAQFSGTSGLIEDSGAALSDLTFQYIYEHDPAFPSSELQLSSLPFSGINWTSQNTSAVFNFSDSGTYTTYALMSQTPIGNFYTGMASVDPNSTLFSADCDVFNCGTLPYPRLDSLREAGILLGSAPKGLSVFNTDNNTLDIFDGSQFRKHISTNQFSGDFTVSTSGVSTLSSAGISKIIAITIVSGTSEQMTDSAITNRYVMNNTSLSTLTLPTSMTVGHSIEIIGSGAGLWKIAQNANQYISTSSGGNPAFTTTGVTGHADGSNFTDCIILTYSGVNQFVISSVQTSGSGVVLN